MLKQNLRNNKKTENLPREKVQRCRAHDLAPCQEGSTIGAYDWGPMVSQVSSQVCSLG